MLNRAIMMGRLTHDPELKTTQAGTQLCRFSIACDRDFKNTSGEKETDFFDCVAWRKTAEFGQPVFRKGTYDHCGGPDAEPELDGQRRK